MIEKLVRSLISGIACCTLLACASAPKPVALASNAVQVPELPASRGADQVRTDPNFAIGPNDQLRIEVFGVEELQRIVRVDRSGVIAYPLIGTVRASGLSPADLADVIEQRLAGQYLKDPRVTVNVEESPNSVVTVDGEVERPGVYPVAGQMTLLRAVATAGGTTDLSMLEDVIVQREVEGRKYIALYNLEAIRRGNYADPQLYPSDIVVVGESRQRQFFRDIIQILPVALTPIILLVNGN